MSAKMSSGYLPWLGLLFLQTTSHVQCDNVLFLGLPYFSHLYPMTFMAKELNQRGHNSYFSVPEKLKKTLQQPEGVHFIDMKDQPLVSQLPEISISIAFKRNRTWEEYWTTLETICDNLLLDEEWLQSLESVNASLMVIDGVFMSSCLTIIPYKLSTPFILMGAQNLPSIHRTPWPYTASPFVMTKYSEKMSFSERIINVLMHLVPYYIVFGAPQKSVNDYAPEKPELSFRDLLGKAELYIIETDVLIDYPVPALPNVEYLGGMATQTAKAIEGDLLKFVNSSENGLIVVSFGSLVGSLPKDHLAKLGEAFKQLNYDIIWNRPGDDYSAANVFLTKWMPQNDLLGHPKTKLFITHCGNGGQFEALYHGVPMLGFPVFADQPHNGKRMQHKGYGITMDMFNYTVEKLVENINEIIDNPKYKRNIKRASDIFKSRPEHPSVRGARIVDDVIKYGGGFLRSYCQDMPLYEYFMLDILAVVLSSALIAIAIIIFILRKCLSFCCRKKIKTE